MNRFAYLTTGFAIKTLSGLSRAKIRIHGEDNIPKGAVIFVINHFTRIETLLLPSYIYDITGVPVWSLADAPLFKGVLGNYLDKVGAVSTKNPDRDMLIVKTLLTGEANWIIFPEGRMVKDKKLVEKGEFMLSYAGIKHPPHTGAATLAIRTEFYRQRLYHLLKENPDEARRLSSLFQIDCLSCTIEKDTFIVPVNITYYPIRAKENILNKLTARFVENISERMAEEIMTEGTMLLSGVDIDIRFGSAIQIKPFLKEKAIKKDISASGIINFDDPIRSKPIMRKNALKIMETYMAAIYSLTTVNHDHLFASIVKLIPFKRIDIQDLKRRVFLATCSLDRKRIYFHTSLMTNQIYLLTDDRYNKFREFITIAKEKGILTQQGNMLVKDMSRFSSPFDFHQVRIDNPISVMANEVEPLTRLQNKLRYLAWQPAFLLRRKIRKHFFKKAVAEYQKDYKDFYVKDESKPPEIGMPFLLKGKSKKAGVLLIHGYMSAPAQVKELADYLSARGIWVYAPRLRGHGTSPDDLAIRSYTDWIASVEEGYAVISNMCQRVVVGGFSTGAALALYLAARINEIEGVFAICPPLRLRDVSAKFAPAVDTWNRLMNMVNIGSIKKEFVENKPETPELNYLRNPISGVREIELLMEALESELPLIHTPAMVAQSQRDPVVDPRGSKELFERLGSEDKRYVLFNCNRHCIIVGRGASRVHRVIVDFVEYLISRGRK